MNPLDNLADINIPQDVSAWPPAIGWYVLVACILAIIVASVLYIRHRKKRLRAREDAISLLLNMQIHSVNEHEKADLLNRMHQVLKQTLHDYLPRSRVLQLHSAQWRNLLMQLGNNSYTEQLIKLNQMQYDQRKIELEPSETRDAMIAWMKASLPPKREPEHV
uniref:DUF4381 domain-containing protein n=1 Tax=Ningiella ruwaisensis TaxID=2364274 RepID=UPI0010A09392|nr:DUF4381 domain-containing protein [Ningiella ruwaisensis]